MARRREKLPGTIWQNRGRWYWRVKLPGREKRENLPLRPIGAKYATNDRGVAEEVARMIYRRAIIRSGRDDETTGPGIPAISELIAGYLRFARSYYVNGDGEPTGEIARIELATRELRELHGTTDPESFGPLALKETRQAMLDSGKLCRRTINQRVGVIKRLFKWAASEQLVPQSIYHGLLSVTGIRRGRLGAREGSPVGPIAEEHVRETMRYLPPTVAAMVELMVLTGMRPGECCAMRPRDIDTTGKLWVYRPAKHKTKHHGHAREVIIGPRGQRVLRSYLLRAPDAWCFVPAEAQQQRNGAKRAARKSKVQPSQTNRSKPDARKLRARYTAHSLRQAIGYAIEAANKGRRAAGERRRVPHWHPNQLRHTAGTIVRREMGLDAARALLGHRTLGITDTYAELDAALARKAARKLG